MGERLIWREATARRAFSYSDTQAPAVVYHLNYAGIPLREKHRYKTNPPVLREKKLGICEAQFKCDPRSELILQL